MTTVLFAGGGTGGHLMPALAIAAEVGRLEPSWRLVFAGATRGIEATVLPERGLPHRLLPLEPFYRRQWWRNARWLIQGPRLVTAVRGLLRAEQPAAVIGTGGYVSGPVVWAAARRGIPTGILELDVQPGLATRMLSSRVREIWTATPETIEALPSAVRPLAHVTGAPIVPPDATRRSAAMERFGLSPDRPVLVVTGGSQGSLAINRLVASWLGAGGAAGAQVIWATGRATYEEFAGLHNPPRVSVTPFLEPMADAWAVADLCVARAGMMTIAELCAWGIPSVLIPLPTAAADHQSRNANALVRAGAAVLLRQGGLTSHLLGDTLDGLLGDPQRRVAIATAARSRGMPEAAAAIAQRVVQLATQG
ncbi:MAG: undecaprenyldiphospho-muramoylpentapeptide beta-N-acetylglucosaminyltransferase [Gemmatimonadales bacterium]